MGQNPDALVVDFFAGSGTTLQSVVMLNAEDGGNRRCVLITNNQVQIATAKLLSTDGMYQGDEEYENTGICQAITIPRIRALLTGKRDGRSINGKYQSGRSIAKGFDENALFLRLDYLDPDFVELGRQFNAIAPMLWMTAGSVGEWEGWDGNASWSLPADSTYGVLFDEHQIAPFAKAVEARSSVTHVWLVTNSDAAFLEMRESLPKRLLAVRQLYQDYLHNFKIKAPGIRRK